MRAPIASSARRYPDSFVYGRIPGVAGPGRHLFETQLGRLRTMNTSLPGWYKAAVASILIVPALAFAHHGISAKFDTQASIEIAGEIEEVTWRNPHVLFTVIVTNDDGSETLWRRRDTVDGNDAQKRYLEGLPQARRTGHHCGTAIATRRERHLPHQYVAHRTAGRSSLTPASSRDGRTSLLADPGPATRRRAILRLPSSVSFACGAPRRQHPLTTRA